MVVAVDMGGSRFAALSALGAAIALFAAPAANAADVTLAGTYVTYSAAAGETNDLSIQVDRTDFSTHGLITLEGPSIRTFTLTDASAPVHAGDGCVQQSASQVICVSTSATRIRVFLGDGDDKLHALGADSVALVTESVDGGPGTDALTGGPYRDRLYGGDGDDRLGGGSGGDRLEGGLGDDQLEGGAGDDTLLGRQLSDGNDMGTDGLTCGDGADTALPGALDTVAADCETRS
jgi:Ca2+-binding RTX toxin-like protein